MKLKLFTLIILSQISILVFAQKSMVLKTYYTPQTIYKQTVTQVNHGTMVYVGKPDFLESLKEKGIENPTISADSTVIEIVMRTGKKQKDETFSVEIEYISSLKSDGTSLIPNGTTIYGMANNSKMNLDSVYLPDLDESFKKVILQTVQSLFSQFTFPEKNMKVGDAFNQEMPISLPIANKTLNMVITSTYKLVNIKDNIAFFDVSQNYTMVSNIMENPITASGGGIGKFKYTLDYNYIIDYKMDSEMILKMVLDDFEINLNQKSCYVQKCDIKKR